MISLYRFFSGYLKLKVFGDKPEGIINLCTVEGISVWNIERRKDCIYLCIPLKDFERLYIARRTLSIKPKVRIIEKNGIYFKLRRFIKRPGIPIGIVVFLGINLFLSCFIWNVQVTGNLTISDRSILEACEKYGVKTCVFSGNIDIDSVKQKLPAELNGIAWASVNIEGCLATVNVSEAVTSEKKDDAPADIIASYDGIIRSMEVTKGTKIAQVGKVVGRGELLVSGILGDGKDFIRSEGTVIAETRRRFTFKVDKSIEHKEIIGKRKTKSVIYFFGIKVPLYLSGIDNDSFSYMTENRLSLFGTELPIGRITRNFYEVQSEFNEIDTKEAESIALLNLTEQLREFDIVSVEEFTVNTQEGKDGYTVNIDLVCSENIAQTDDIQYDSKP